MAKKNEPTKEVSVVDDSQANSFLSMVAALAANPEVDVAKIQQIVDIQEHILDRNAEQSFNAAMVKAQHAMPVVMKDKLNTQTQSKYSSYEAILKAAKPAYTAHGLSVMFYEGDTTKEGEIRIMADIMHEDGCVKTRFIDVPLDATGIAGKVNKTGTHAKGSSVSYGRSYLIRMIFNISTGEDDDGNGAGSQYITEEQAMDLAALIDENIKDKKYKGQLLAYMKVESFDLIPIKQFKKAETAINTYIKAAQK